MKKFFAFAAAVLMLASCVVSEETNFNRTHYDLTLYTSHMVESSVEVTLRNLRSYPDINDEGTTFTGTADRDVCPVIKRVGDNAWTSTYKGSSLEFSLNISRVGADDELEEKWIFSDLVLSHHEEGGFVFSLVSEGEVKYAWERDENTFSVTYNLVPTGRYNARFLLDGENLDWCTVSFNRGEMVSSSSAK